MSKRAVSGAAHRIVALGAVFLLGALAACGQSGPGDVVARVGGTPIAKAALDHWSSVLAGRGAAADRQGPQRQALQARVLGFLISAQRTLGEAAELGVKASDREAQAQLELFKYDQIEGVSYEGIPRQGELPALFSNARSHPDRLWLMKLAILTAKVQGKHLADAERRITQAQIAGYYDRHKSSFVLPERRDVEWIVTYSEATLQKAVREIRAGKSFLGVAKHVSLDKPTIIGMVRHPRLEKELARHVFAAKPHVLTGPFRQSQNHYSFEVTKVTPARLQTLARSQASIRHQLAARWVASGLTGAFERKWTSKTSCRSGYVVAGCRQYVGAVP